MPDLLLAVGHHMLIFAIFGVLLIEYVLVRPGMTLSSVRTLAAVDLYYGLMAAAVILVGFARAIWAAKGWGYYSHNLFFWAKLAVFLLIGLISIRPTLVFPAWRRAGRDPQEPEVLALKQWLRLELGLFALLPVFAAAMARGYGQLPH